MTQPSFVPIADADQVRPARHLRVPGPWSPDRPAELVIPARSRGSLKGMPGPDQGFALSLAARFVPRLHLGEGEHTDDAVLGCALVASRRCAMFGRAPCIHDLTLAFSLFGFLGDAPGELVAARTGAFRGLAHDYGAQRRLVDGVPEATLRLTPGEVEARAGEWRELLGLTGPVTASGN